MQVSIVSCEIIMELIVSTLKPEQILFCRYFLPKCISYKNVIHIKIEIFLLIYSRKVCFGKGGGLVPKGNKSLPWPMETQLTNAHMRHQASMS